MNDKLVICPCDRKSDALYSQEIEGTKITNSQCFTCGFISNTLMRANDQFMTEQLEVLPELYKDLIWEDNTGQKWMPSTTNIPDKGMVFANGSSKDDWCWSAVLAIDVKDEEKEKYPIPSKKGEFYKHRMDMTTIKNFGKYEFMDALEYIGAI